LSSSVNGSISTFALSNRRPGLVRSSGISPGTPPRCDTRLPSLWRILKRPRGDEGARVFIAGRVPSSMNGLEVAWHDQESRVPPSLRVRFVVNEQREIARRVYHRDRPGARALAGSNARSNDGDKVSHRMPPRHRLGPDVPESTHCMSSVSTFTSKTPRSPCATRAPCACSAGIIRFSQTVDVSFHSARRPSYSASSVMVRRRVAVCA
jgi:hypothetical protein